MTIHTCTCGKLQTTRNAKKLARTDDLGIDMLYLNCQSCGSTFCVISRKDQEKMRKEREAKCRAA